MGYTMEQIDAVKPGDRSVIVLNHRLLRILGCSQSETVATIGSWIKLDQSIAQVLDNVQRVVNQYKALVPTGASSGPPQDAAQASRGTDYESQLRDLGYSNEQMDAIKPEFRAATVGLHQALSGLGLGPDLIFKITPHIQSLSSVVDTIDSALKHLRTSP
jgi:hypothetical protein